MSFYDRNSLKNGILSKLYAWLEDALSNKADKGTTLSSYGITNAYTKTETDTALAGKANSSTTYTKTQVDAALNLKANVATTYTKTEVDTALGGKADASTTYTKTQVDTALSGKADSATTLTGYHITDAYTKTEVDTALENKASTWTLIGTQTGTSTDEQEIGTLEIGTDKSLQELLGLYSEVMIQVSATEYASGIGNPLWCSLAGTFMIEPITDIWDSKPNAALNMGLSHFSTSTTALSAEIGIRTSSSKIVFMLYSIRNTNDPANPENWIMEKSGLGRTYGVVYSVYAR